MSTWFDVKSSVANYRVDVRPGLFERTLLENREHVVIGDDFFSELLSARHLRFIGFKPSEEYKALERIPEFILQLRKLGANRETRLMAVGGGIVQDACGFVASIYMRGITWMYIPTTLLAMVDSCIGGKSSINIGPYKNLVGTFYPPAQVIIDPMLTSSLSVEQRVNGLIEACKISYCHGADAFRQYLAFRPTSSMSPQAFEDVIRLSLLSKKFFIEVDEFDSRERLLLNFGHTFAHAIEGASDFQVPHGLAVGVGVLCAVRLGEQIGRNYAGVSRVHLLTKHIRALLDEVPTLADRLSGITVQEVLDRFLADKKHRSEYYSVVIVSSSGDVELARTPKDSTFLRQVEASLKETIDSLQVGHR